MDCVLKDLIAISKDGEWGKGEPFDESVEMLAIRGTDFEDIRFGSATSTPRRHIAKRHAERKILQPWDVIIEAAGGTKNQITGRTVLLRPQLFARSELPFTCASFSRFIRFNTELCDPVFMFWYLQHLYASGLMHAYHTQHTGVARFQWTTFSEREPLDLPPLPIQRRIAGILSAYDELIENSQRRIKILESMARALYREWFVHFRFPGHESVPRVPSPLGEIPKGWEVKNLGGMTKLITKGTTPTTLGREFQQEGINFVKAESIEPSGILIESKFAKIDADTHELLQRSQLCSGDILFSIAGVIGRVCSVPSRILPANTNQALAIIRSAAAIHVPFLYMTLRDDSFKNHCLGHVVQTAQANVSLSVLKAVPIVCPPSVLLTEFNTHAESLLRQIEVLSEKIQNLRRTHDLLLPRLLSGQLELETEAA